MVIQKPISTPEPHPPTTPRCRAFTLHLFKPVDASSLAAFRVLFGAIMVWEVFRYWPLIADLYIDHPFHFTYEFFSFVSPWPGNGMYAHYIVMGLAAAGVMLGLCYRFCATLFFACFTYLFLLDQATYLNHFYLVCLLSFLMIFLNANRWAAVDILTRTKRPVTQTVPFWNILILRAQLVVVYLYAGIAKIDTDWLTGVPMASFAKPMARLPLIGPLLVQDWAALYLFTYGGMVFDLAIGFLLLYRRTRTLALVPLALFHLTNAVMFSIGIFPWLMLASTILFFEPNLPRVLWNRVTTKNPCPALPETNAQTSTPPAHKHILIVSFLAAWLAVQILVPLRHWLYPGNPTWTEEGSRFAWHMMLRRKSGWLTFAITAPTNGRTLPLIPAEGYAPRALQLSPMQLTEMSTRPHLIMQYAQYLKDHTDLLGIQYPIIRVFSLVSLNGRPHQYLIDPNTDLAQVDNPPFAPSSWIVPLDPDQSLGVYPKLDLKRFDKDLTHRFPNSRFWLNNH